MKNLLERLEDAQGRVAAPIMMYMFGVPGILCFLAWLFFFRG